MRTAVYGVFACGILILSGCSDGGIGAVQSSSDQTFADVDRSLVPSFDASGFDQSQMPQLDLSVNVDIAADSDFLPTTDLAVLADTLPDAQSDVPMATDGQSMDVLANDQGIDAFVERIPVDVCGDGLLNGFEQCDDGNVLSGDGCDSACTVENWTIDTGRFSQQVTVASDSLEVYAFTIDGAGTLGLSINLDQQCAWPPWLDAQIVRLADEHVVAHWPANANGRPCQQVAHPLEPGPHELRFRPEGQRQLVTFQVELSIYQFIGAAGLYPIRIANGGNERFEFVIEGEQRWEFATTGVFEHCEVDTWMDLYRLDEDGERLLDFDNDGGQGTCSRLSANFEPGRYALQVRERFRRAIEALHLNARTEGICGDGVIDVGEECDDAALNGVDTCSDACRRRSVCGNGQIEIGETCDDQNQIPGDGCDENCQQEVLCGNAVIDPGEDCDDGNFENGDGCDFFCTFEFTQLVRGKTIRRGHFPRNGADWFAFNADGPGRLEAYTFVPVDDNWNCRPSADTLLSIFLPNPDGEEVLLHENDDDPNNAPCSYLDVEVGTGPHLIRVAATDDFAAINDYSLFFRFARDISGLRQAQGGFVAAGSDLYSFQTFQRGRVEITMTPFGGACEDDVDVAFFRQRSSLVIPSDVSRINGCISAAAILDPGLYDLLISRSNGGAMGTYTLDLAWPD